MQPSNRKEIQLSNVDPTQPTPDEEAANAAIAASETGQPTGQPTASVTPAVDPRSPFEVEQALAQGAAAPAPPAQPAPAPVVAPAPAPITPAPIAADAAPSAVGEVVSDTKTDIATMFKDVDATELGKRVVSFFTHVVGYVEDAKSILEMFNKSDKS